MLRQHYARRIPPREGKVYNTTAIARYQLPCSRGKRYPLASPSNCAAGAIYSAAPVILKNNTQSLRRAALQCNVHSSNNIGNLESSGTRGGIYIFSILKIKPMPKNSKNLKMSTREAGSMAHFLVPVLPKPEPHRRHPLRRLFCHRTALCAESSTYVSAVTTVSHASVNPVPYRTSCRKA